MPFLSIFFAGPPSAAILFKQFIVVHLLLLKLLLLFSCCRTRSAPIPFDPSVLITVKTTIANHRSRVDDALATWAQTIVGRKRAEDKTQIVFVSDSMSSSQFPLFPHRIVKSTECPAGHTNAALCCKMAAELRIALQRLPDFWCHFDDDNFVLLANLRAFLRQFRPHHDDLYLGRPSTSSPVVLPQVDNIPTPLFNVPSARRKRPFWFGTGGAGICLSATTLRRLRSFVAGQAKQKGHFQWLCAELGVPDDVTLGFILENLLNIPLTRTDRLHSHLDRVDAIPRSELTNQISLSGSRKDDNLVDVPKQFRWPNDNGDLLRFHALFKFILMPEEDGESIKRKKRESAQRHHSSRRKAEMNRIKNGLTINPSSDRASPSDKVPPPPFYVEEG